MTYNYWNDNYSHWGRYNGWGWFNRSRGGKRRIGWFTCYKNDHLSPNHPYKDKIDLKFCIKVVVGGQPLEEFPIILEKIKKK